MDVETWNLRFMEMICTAGDEPLTAVIIHEYNHQLSPHHDERNY